MSKHKKHRRVIHPKYISLHKAPGQIIRDIILLGLLLDKFAAAAWVRAIGFTLLVCLFFINIMVVCDEVKMDIEFKE